MVASSSLLDLPLDARVDPQEFIRAAMEWHFNPETGSAYWLARARSLDFDPRRDIKSIEDLALFPNIVNELRQVRVEDLIPRGYGPHPDSIGVYESAGTTGAPKRVIIRRDWLDRSKGWMSAHLDAHGLPRNVNWLGLLPSGPHMAGEIGKMLVTERGGLWFTVDLDPRWVKKCIAEGHTEVADAYVEHLVAQATFLLRTQEIGVLMTTPPVLKRITRHDDVVELINQKVKGIIWGGTHIDVDTRHLYRTQIFPSVKLVGIYGSTTILGEAIERPGLTDDDPCIFDPPSLFIIFTVIDPGTGRRVGYGERGQVMMNHLSKNLLLPNNLERDLAIRIEAPEGQESDSVADVSPLTRFDKEAIVEGVY